MQYCLNFKLKYLKRKLYDWNKKVFGMVELNIDTLVEELNALNLVAAEEGQMSFGKVLEQMRAFFTKKSRERRVLEGDSNTQFFHESLVERMNQMIIIKIRDEWVEGVDNVKHRVKQFFKRPVDDGIQLIQLDLEDNGFFVSPFSKKEIKEVAWSCDGIKARA